MVARVRPTVATVATIVFGGMETMQNWILMAQNSKGQTMRACSQIAEDDIPSLEAANRLADKLEQEEPGFIVKEAY